MNDKEQRHHRSVTQAIGKRIDDAEVLILELDKRQVELTQAVHKDIVLLKDTTETSFFVERTDRDAAIHALSQQIVALQTWQTRTYGYRLRMLWLRLREFLIIRWTMIKSFTKVGMSDS